MLLMIMRLYDLIHNYTQCKSSSIREKLSLVYEIDLNYLLFYFTCPTLLLVDLAECDRTAARHKRSLASGSNWRSSA